MEFASNNNIYNLENVENAIGPLVSYLFNTLGVSRKKIAKKITINVPINRNVYTSASIRFLLNNLNYTTPCFRVVTSPNRWNAPNST
jgi:hypothetical protein